MYRKIKIDYSVSKQNESTIKVEALKGRSDKGELNHIFLIVTNPPEKIKEQDHTTLQLDLLDMKIEETLNLMPPWIFGGDTNVEVILHYVLNKDLY